MRLAFFVNEVATEVDEFATTRLARAAAQGGHEVWYVGVGDVELHRQDRTWPVDRCSHLLRRDEVDVGADDVGPLGRQRTHQRGTDTGPAPGHHRGPTGETRCTARHGHLHEPTTGVNHATHNRAV